MSSLVSTAQENLEPEADLVVVYHQLSDGGQDGIIQVQIPIVEPLPLNLEREIDQHIQEALAPEDSLDLDTADVIPQLPELETLLVKPKKRVCIAKSPSKDSSLAECDEEDEEGSQTDQSVDALQVPGIEGVEGTEESDFDLMALALGAAHYTEEFLKRTWVKISWSVSHFHALPRWLQDNDFIFQGYRPPLPSFWQCLTSIFSIHTETGNIWTHMLGCIAFLGCASFFLSSPEPEIRGEDKMVFSAFFTGAVLCLGLSTCFHTFLCHSEWAGKLFSKLDYVGIAMLIMGSFVPWLYYSFYCHPLPRLIYLVCVTVLGLTSIIVSLWPRFGEPKLRPLRAGVFMSFGLSGIVPAIHYSLAAGWMQALAQASMGWLILMGLLYVVGTMFYALRVPERFFPGKFDIWFHSHQIFHVFVVAAAFVHYHGITEMAMYRMINGECSVEENMPWS